MPVKRRKKKRKPPPLTDAQRAWLVDDRENSSFTGFDTDENLRKLFDEHGDKKRYQLLEGMWFVTPRGWQRPTYLGAP